MKIYFAGADASIPLFEKLKIDDILIAYPFLKKKNIIPKDKYFVDSGAFSAYNTGIKIDIDEYIDFIKRSKCKIYVGLDVIKDEKKTKENILYMKAKGLNDVIPTFHYPEPYEYLDYYLENFDYVALGGVALMGTGNELKQWLNECFKRIQKHWPKKIHGFGINNWEILKTYPFYSVDATSWNNPHKFGQHFDFKGGKLHRLSHKQKHIKRFLSKEDQLIDSIKQFKQAEKYITQLWEKRGISWQ